MQYQVEAAIKATINYLEVAFYGQTIPTALQENFDRTCALLDDLACLSKSRRAAMAAEEYGYETLKDLHWDLIDAGLMVEFAGVNAYTIEGRPFNVDQALMAAGVS